MKQADSLTLLGTKGGPALRAPGRSFLPTSNLLNIGERKIIIDCGIGVTQALAYSGHSAASVTDIFITHLHSDHMLEMGGLIHTAWTSGLHHPIAVYGPAGTARIWTHFLEMMSVDLSVRVLDEGRPKLQELVTIHEYSDGDVAVDGAIAVTALRTIHPPLTDSFALKFIKGDQKICFSGDSAYLPALAAFAERATILVHEAMLQSGIDYVIAKTGNANKCLYKHLLASHSFARDVGRIANDAKVDLLVLNHLIPAERDIAGDGEWIEEVRQSFQGRVIVGSDGLCIPF
jgi:ribonuclease BN (tRNA processing enzyme)